MNIPEDIRPYPIARNPHSRKELWRSQDDIQELISMTEENWYPETNYNIYNQPDYKKPLKTTKKEEETII